MDRANQRIEGSVSMFMEEDAGVEIKFMDVATGNVLDMLSTVVYGNDFAGLLAELSEKLKLYVKRKN